MTDSINNSILQIEEINEMSENARTNPFRCKDEGGDSYYVKTLNAGGKSLAYEWIAGNLAKIFELPIPDFFIAEMPFELIEYSDNQDIKDYCKSGFAFASKLLEFCNDVSFDQLENVDAELRAKILLFDWAILNIDRQISAKGGNPNMLYNALEKQLYIIDHNLAFDSDVSREEFWLEHPFIKDFDQWSSTFKLKGINYLETCINNLRAICEYIPDQWLDVAELGNEVEKLEECFRYVKSILERYQEEQFWIRE
ncbi:hypothetical protein PQO01_20235 [Lentisphaera marina]|uniref:HipA family kinase n=1 Tax=Lentisphaera marina TaxID=1111041 RepID=UPI0023650DE4|nr:HipA family kinase [Lentisphaera marina]MDD7987289.1 hypothetical protein [Lentisphaera marina]